MVSYVSHKQAYKKKQEETSQFPLDIIMTNKPHLFRECDVHDPGIRDHAMVYGIMKANGMHSSPKQSNIIQELQKFRCR